MDMPKEKESVDGLKQCGRSARNTTDEGEKDVATTQKVCNVFDGKKHSIKISRPRLGHVSVIV